LIKKKLGDGPASLQILNDMEKISKQLINILEFERIYEQLGSEELTFVDVCKFFNEAVALVSDFKGATFEFKCEGLEVRADSLLRQLLYNLMDNTLKHGEKANSIKFYFKKDANNLVLIYEDNGVGIAVDQKPHLFERDFGKRSGIGLHMIKRIIDTYGWKLEENGELGVGARFVMKIPENNFRFKEKTK
jgi:signal transduction histidine kinase